MPAPTFIDTPSGRRIACCQSAGASPGVVFLGGFASDMTGTKAQYLHAWARQSGRAFLRFDYSGHGASGGDFRDGAIGDWLADARAALAATEGRQVLVGSSMGGWIALLLARVHPDRLAGLVGIAAAPDFTEDSLWAGLEPDQRAALMREGQLALPSDYGAPLLITRRLIEDGRRHLVLRAPLALSFPVRLLQGTADRDVPPEVALRLLAHASGPDIHLTLVKGADHRFSTPECLALITAQIIEVLAAGGRDG